MSKPLRIKNEHGDWVSVPAIKGESAYEIAVKKGFKGTEEEWLASLHVYAEVTEVENGHKITIRDAKGEKSFIIDETPKSRIAEVLLKASAWSGDASPYSQVVNIDGITNRSQVDLTPSVEQLAIFHNKDLAFVTENENGTVTVYVIGQKPENDYTIQATITEVNV